MLGLILFLFLVSSIGALVLYFNKSESAEKIKNVLKKILENLKDLFKNLRELIDLIKQLIPLDNDEHRNDSSISENLSPQKEESLESDDQSITPDLTQQEEQSQQEESLESDDQSIAPDLTKKENQDLNEDKNIR